MKKLGNILFSMTTSVILMLVFAIAIAWATFIENDFGTETAKKLVYVSRWFEILLFMLVLNISGNVVKYKLINRKKWSILLFHLAFVVILAGGAISRYVGFEGSMHIREGDTVNQLRLNHTYLFLTAEYKGLKETVSTKVRLTPKGSNNYSQNLEIGGRKINIKTELFLPYAKESIVESDQGSPAVSLFVMDRRKSGYERDIIQGETALVGDMFFSFKSGQPGNITFRYENGIPLFISRDTVLVTGMGTKDTVVLVPGKAHLLAEKTIYRSIGSVFVVKSFMPNASKNIVSVPENETGSQGLVVNLSTEGISKRLSLINNMGEGIPSTVELDDIKLSTTFGAKMKQLPFSLELKKFILDRYPGSNSPSSYASEVVLHDKENGVNMPYRIFMNNTLKYKGYRFFQSSYDRDERGTILSVSYDFYGTWVSYLGYFLMFAGMLLTLLNKNSRFRYLLRQSKELKKVKSSVLTLILTLTFSTAFTQNVSSAETSKAEHLKEFNSLLVQGNGGRVQPMYTVASEVLRKVYKKSSYNGNSSSEVILGMLNNSERWQKEPFIKISNTKLAAELGISSGYISYREMFDKGKYKLQDLVDATYHKEPKSRNKYDKEVLNLDERINICHQIFTGSFFNFFPIPNDDKHNWTSAITFPPMRLNDGSDTPKNMLAAYLKETLLAETSNKWAIADERLNYIKSFQIKFGGKAIPGQKKVTLEIVYMQLNTFGRLMIVYMLTGIILLLLNLLSIFQIKIKLKGIQKVGFFFSLLIFIAYSLGIILRWIISEHAPWSNGYETMIFVGWATALAGLLFSRHSGVTLAITNILAGIMLMVAGLSWMNPEITPLVPVLKSYWLIIHVAVITSSYGFLAIGALLGFLNLLLITFRTSSNNMTISFQVKELSLIIEISLIIGLILLTIGSFLGGIWANESWGRYWGWDPKETWALITVLVYAIVLHINKIPGVKGQAWFNGLAVIGFSSVLMTFFGVNYYLSGLHSYAQGDAPPIPNAVYFVITFIILLLMLALQSERRRGLNV